jgi:hypothetical protein
MYGMNECDQNKQAITTINASLMFSNDNQATYATNKFHELMKTEYNITSTTLKDPLLEVVIADQNSSWTKRTLLPAKQLMFCDNNSKIQLLSEDNKKPLIINAQCKYNPNLATKTFKKQFKNIMKDFFTEPTVAYFPEENTQELEEAKVITVQQESVILHIPTRPLFYEKIIHGQNSCSSNKDLFQSLLHENVPHNTNVYSALAQRECTGSFNKIKALRKFTTNNKNTF